MLFISEQLLMIIVTFTSLISVMSNSTYSSAQQEQSSLDFEMQNMAEDICAYNPCKNGGKCSHDGATFTCTCRGPWTGKVCETDICAYNPCKNGGKCSHDRVAFKCTCRGPWSGKFCETDTANTMETTYRPSRTSFQKNFTGTTPYNYTTRMPSTQSTKTPAIDLCPSSPCQNEGVCVQDGNSFSCFCKPPYFGVVCEKVPCMDNPCQNGGTCVHSGYSFKCKCKHPFSGDVCQYDICHDNPCFNGGTCKRSGNSFKCKCRYGYVGIICEKEGYQSFPEETSTIETNENYNETTNFTTIKPGNCTADSDCLNRGFCSRNKCECKPNFGGYWCERNLLCEKLQPTCHIMGADCKMIGHKAICDCPSGKMYEPQSGVCEDICNPWRCLHGKCEIDGRTYKCICDTGYNGHRCSESVQAIAEQRNIWLYIMISMVILTSLLLIQQIYMFFRYRKLESSTSNSDVLELKSTEPPESTAI